MTEQELLDGLTIGEGIDWEFKSAQGGLPASMWETYSAMANTDGGVIGLGVDEKDGKFTIIGLSDAAKMRKNFWDTINNRGKVSANLLTDSQVSVVEVEGNVVLVAEVPRASRRERPIYVGQNPLNGTYRRNYEGDYKCRRDEVGRMLADQSEEPQDTRILENFSVADLDKNSIDQYRNRFSARSAAHPWLKLSEEEFLEKLGAIRADRQTGDSGVTVAGLLMFGKDEAIRDPLAVPEFNLDYRERLSDDPAVRWTDRIHTDGTWVCNIFQFYERIVPRLTGDLKIPFRLEDLVRKDDTIVHEAIREAFVNSLIHGDHRGQGGVVIEKYRDRLEFSNPGTLLLSLEQLLRGGVSECRNKTLQTMFSLLGYGEKAGSGVDKIRQGWASQQWRAPKIEETNRPDRVRVVLPMVSLLPQETVERLRERFGSEIDSLQPVEMQALVTACSEQSVDNPRLREISQEHPADLSKVLQGLVAKGLLEQHGQRRWAYYKLTPTSSSHNEESSSHTERSSSHTERSSSHNDAIVNDDTLLHIAQPAREQSRLAPQQMEQIILRLCYGRFLTMEQIGVLLDRNARGIRNRFLRSLVTEGRLTPRYPNDPTHPRQAYTTVASDE
jgi:ATP-dependent DNA helicase RecG